MIIFIAAIMDSLLIYNANLLSFHDGFNSTADAMLVEDGIIRAVDQYELLEPLIGPITTVIDAQQKTVMPGFNDTHIHVWKVGNLKTFMLDVRGVPSKEALLDMLSDYNRLYPDVSWITARGFNEAAWADKTLPEKTDLDKVTTSKPVYVIRTCAHIAVANTKAIEISGITKDSVAPEGGEIRTGIDGKPNGIFTETALGLLTKHIPAYTKEELKTMVRAAREEMYSYGITAATDPAVDPLLLEAYYEMYAAGEPGFRLHAMPIILPDGGATPYAIPEYFQSDYFTVNAVKFFSDGGLSGKTAALKRHYRNTTEKGVLRLQKEQYLSLCRQAQEKGLSVATHAIGDAAIELVVACYRQLNLEFPGGRNRVEHLGLPQPHHLEDMSRHNIAASMQTIFINELGKNFIQYLDEEYLGHCYPVRSVMQQGILAALSSDAPVVKNINPLKGVEAAVTRKDSEGNTIAPAEAIPVEAALKAYTYDAAQLSGMKNYGTLKTGAKADFIMLEKDPRRVAIENIAGIQTERTFVGGKCVWKSAHLS